MKTATNEKPTAKPNADTARHPAEIEADRLRAELCEERIKTEALSRRCIKLSGALDAAILAEENRAEKSMFDHINGNCYHRKAIVVAGKHRSAYERKMAKVYRKACKRNAFALCASAVATFAAILFGFTGIIHTVFAAILTGCALMAFGWALNDCVYLLGRCKK